MSMPVRITVVLAAALCSACSGGGASAPSSQIETLSAPGCAGVENIVAENQPRAINATTIRVQHLGDPGSPELLGEVANPVTWDVGTLTGLHVPPSAQRGYRDAAPPVAASAFQLQCDAGGFLINSWTFPHDVPMVGGGPVASVRRDLTPGVPLFNDASSTLIIEARVAVPWTISETPPVGSAVSQVSLFYYAEDKNTLLRIAHVIGLFDNRPAGVEGSGVESLGNDTQVFFASSPLAPVDAAGAPVKYVTVSSGSGQMRLVQTWNDSTLFRAEVSYAQFRDMIAELRRRGATSISADPLDYRVRLFGVLGEVFPGAAPGHNVALAGSVTNLALSQRHASP